MASPREHIEEIRRDTFYIGHDQIPKAHLMLDQAVKFLSAELYTKDVHFLMELIQNAEDNEYLAGVDPSLEFVITSRDITATGAPATLLLFNNEKGFSAKNIESICSLGHSTKKGNRKRGYIGEKGIGFKSVFLVSAQPYVFSNGYQIRFNENPCPHCKLGYIVPEWVEENPSLSDIREIYGSSSTVPTTTIVLPLKLDKVSAVKRQLSSIHPEILLFLSKIKRLSVRENNVDPGQNTVSSIAITKEANFMTRKDIDAESYLLYLSAEESGSHHSYHVWKQRFPVKQEHKVERRMEVEEWVITLAFPNGDRLQRGMSSPGVYAFLPTEMVTNFPFIIQADFLLASSRETILLDNIWNQGILDCVPIAFINALVSLVRTVEDAPLSSLPPMFEFLPINSSPYPQLNIVRESIRVKLAEESIVPSESYLGQKFFHKPCEVGRIMPAFWNILKRAREEGVGLHNLSSHGRYILNSSFDRLEYDQILNFLGVEAVDNEWYAKCIQGSNLVMGVSEETYIELLLFIADNWSSKFFRTNMKYIPLIKYVGLDGSVSLSSINSAITNQNVLRISDQPNCIPWLIDWNKEFRCMANCFFLPKSTQEAITLCPRKDVLLNWLHNQAKVTPLDVYSYAGLISKHFNCDRKLVIAYTHFLYRSLHSGYLSVGQTNTLCRAMPLVDNYGNVTTTRNAVLVPANGSKWAQLIASNPWRKEGYVELGEDYSFPASFVGQRTTGEKLIGFLKSYLPAVDIPDISPPNAEIPAVSGPLTKQNVFLLLNWIHHLKYRRTPIPGKFLNCIKKGSWLKITMNGSPGYKPPSQSFLLTPNRGNSNWGNILQNGSVLVDIPLINQSFYGDEINEYEEELKTIGVMFEYREACEFIGNHLMSLAACSTLTKSNVMSILHFIKFLRKNFLPPENFICSIKGGRWMKTIHGYKSPVESILYDEEWETAAQVSDIPFIDLDYYGEEILCFKIELQLIGVMVGFKSYQVVADNLKSSSCLTYLTAKALLLILDCMRYSSSSKKLVQAIKYMNCLKTDLGYKSPSECFLLDPEWGCLLKVFNFFPSVDCNFYGSINHYKEELKQLGVKVEFEDAVKAFVHAFRQQASSFTIRTENVFSFLSCYRKLNGTSYKFPSDLKQCICEVKWLRTRLGDYRSPNNCILFSPPWESISPITILPFIDDSDYCYGKKIHEYKNELKSMGVVIEFKAGARLVASGLYFPYDPCCITPLNVFMLLRCIRFLLEQENYSFPDSFLKKVSREWLKTYTGYRTPDKCCLFDPMWALYVRRSDGPFIDEEFYGSEIITYKKELRITGVIDGVDKVCSLLASHLDSHSDFASIVRIYTFLRKHKWKPKSEATSRIWIPNGIGNGKWAEPGECVIHDKDGLFGFTLNVLDKYYQQPLLEFFMSAFDVKFNPSLDDYCKLWKVWESSRPKLTHDECCAFWSCVMRNRSSKTERILAEDLVKLPAVSNSGEIFLFNRRDVFIADDLQLKDLFQKFSPRPLFVWYPRQILTSIHRNKLFEVYRKIGVRTISESVQKEELSLPDGVKLIQLNPRGTLIGKVLVGLILGFLADPSLNMEVKERHETVECLLNLTVMETIEPINASYSLLLSSGEIVNVKPSRMLRWDKASSKFFAQKLDRSGGHKILIEYATYFAEVIAKGVLWQKDDLVVPLSELIKLAFLLDFNEEAVHFLMKSKNLQVFQEDEEFLSDAFPSA